MTRKEYVENFKNVLGYSEDYLPKHSCRKIAKDLIDEIRLQMPTDTMAREREGDAVMALVLYGNESAMKAGIRLGNMLMKHNYDDRSLLDAMTNAAKALLTIKKKA
jgi:hypothetical protein